eukprot:scaffold3783_cov77-Phaeocystis_antarctica.AAC.3
MLASESRARIRSLAGSGSSASLLVFPFRFHRHRQRRSDSRRGEPPSPLKAARKSPRRARYARQIDLLSPDRPSGGCSSQEGRHKRALGGAHQEDRFQSGGVAERNPRADEDEARQQEGIFFENRAGYAASEAHAGEQTGSGRAQPVS